MAEKTFSRMGTVGARDRPLVPTEYLPNLATLQALLEQQERDYLFLNAHREEWIAQYPDRWIVVYLEELVENDSASPEEAIRKAIEKGVPSGQGVLEYLTTNPTMMLLPGVST